MSINLAASDFESVSSGGNGNAFSVLRYISRFDPSSSFVVFDLLIEPYHDRGPHDVNISKNNHMKRRRKVVLGLSLDFTAKPVQIQIGSSKNQRSKFVMYY